jgi:hypothetical protein
VARDWPTLAPPYQPVSCAMAKGLTRAAKATKPRVPDAVLNFMLFSSRI